MGLENQMSHCVIDVHHIREELIVPVYLYGKLCYDIDYI